MIDGVPVIPDDFNRGFIERLALHIPVVNRFLHIYMSGNLTYEQALIGMVSYLAAHKKELERLQLERFEASVPSMVIEITDKQFQEIKRYLDD